jgi:hypothetical protein
MAYRIADDWGLKVFQVIPQGKRPMIKDFEHQATTDGLSISKMWAATPNANIGIATGLANGIVVVDLDGDEAVSWFEELGFPLGAEVHTPSGGKHYYYAIEPDVEIKTSRGEIHRGVDVRAEGGLVVGPGSIIAGKMYRGDLSYIPEAPQELLDLLPRRQHFTSAPIPEDVEPIEAASEKERRQIAWVTEELDQLERPWREGAGWRSTVFQVSCWLWRMVRSPYYALDEDNAVTLLLTHAPTDDRWGDSNVLGEWEDAKKRTVGQYAEPPVELMPQLEVWTGFPTDVAFPSIDGEPYAQVWNTRPAGGSGHLWQRRQALLVAALKAGMSDVRAATLVWHSAAAKGEGVSFGGQTFLDEDSRCITEKDLWREVDQAKEGLEKNSGTTVAPAPAEERPAVMADSERPSLLTDAERAVLRSPEGEWWGTRALNWAEQTFAMINEPYYRMNRWTILSVIFGPKAVLPRPGANDRNITLYQAIVGPTTSGKTEALNFVRNVLDYFYMMEDFAPSIGGNTTSAALTKLLIERDGLPSWFHMDEAHTKIHEWKKVTGPFSDMPGLITELYDGRVDPRHRAMEKDSSGKGARTYFTVHFMGTVEGMAAEMGPEDWESGFLNRYVWAIGDDPIMDETAIAGDWISEGDLDEDEKADSRNGTLMYQQWAVEFQEACQKIGRLDGKPARMRLPEPVIERHRKFASDLQAIAMKSQYRERLRSTFKRLNESTLRCAALVALSDGRLRITKTDLLIAIEQTEEWAANILLMVELTDETIRTREVNMIERHLLEQGGAATISSIHRIQRLRNRSREVEGLIGELVAQGRAERTTIDNEGTKAEILRTKGVLHGGGK